MSTGTSSGSPPAKLPDPCTAEDLVTILERYPPAAIAAIPGALAALIRSCAELDETVMALTAGIERALALRGRLGELLLQAQAAWFDIGAPQPGGKVPNGH